MQETEEITAVKEAIHNPDDPRHFARIRKTGNDVIVTYEETSLARSKGALKLLEVGFDVYDPVFYIPREDIRMDLLKRTDKTTHCPLKGDTEYFDLEINGEKIPDAAWSYIKPYDRSEIIRGYVAFDTAKVQVTEYTAGEPKVKG